MPVQSSMSADGRWLLPSQRIESPNQDERPPQTHISLIVIHCISLPANHFGGSYILDLFRNQLNCACHPDFHDLEGLCVSSHLLIRRDASVVQFVAFDKRAWHAGLSAFAGRRDCNDFSIGIELEGTDASPFNQSQYLQLASVCSLLMQRFERISQDRIVGHSDVAPGRKSDPGVCFEWDYFKELLNEKQAHGN